MIGAPTGHARHTLELFVAVADVEVIAFDKMMAAIGIVAFVRYGKGRGHPAQLNNGDCLSYAIARSRNLPRLFKGDDFRRADLVPAHDPAL